MGMFTKGQERTAENVYDRIKKHLKPKDGAVHVVMVNSFGKLGNAVFDCDDKYTTQIDHVILKMQYDGYQIIDIKFNSIRDKGLSGETDGYQTLIMYK